MRSRSLFILGAALLLSEVVNSQALSNLDSRAKTDPSQLDECTFEGNSDFYGVGVRVGFYLTWLSGLVAFVFNPEDCEGQADAQTIFLIANLIALVILQSQAAADTNVVVPVLLFYMFFGGSVIGITSATASLGTFSRARRLKKISVVVRQIFVQLTFIGMLTYSFYFWAKGFKYFKTFPQVCGGTFVFPVTKRLSLNAPSGGSVLALVFLVLFYLMIWLVSYKRLRRSFGDRPKPRSKFSISNGSEFSSVGSQTPPWDQRQRKWTILGGTLITFTIAWAIAGIEFTLKWNRVTGVNDLSTTGQLIPFVIGIASLPSAFWGVLAYWQDIKEDERSRRLSNTNDMADIAYPEKPQVSPGTPYFDQTAERSTQNAPADASHPLLAQGNTAYVSPSSRQ